MTSLRCRGERGHAWLAKSIAYACTAVLPTRVTSPKHFSLLATVRLLGPSSTIVEGRISLVATSAKGERQQNARYPSCVRILFAYLRVPCPRLCVCQPVRLGRYCVPASACGTSVGPLCACVLYFFARAFPVSACVICLALDRHTQLR